MLISAAQILQRMNVHSTLPPQHAEHPDGFVLDDYGVNLFWGSYEYSVSWDCIRTPVELLAWIAHISQKTWKHSSPQRISRLIQAVCARRNWAIG